VSKSSNLTPSGESKDATTENLPASQSSSVESPSTSATSATTAKETSPTVSQRTPNLQDAPNAARLIQALAAKLGTLVEWKKLSLKDGRKVYALVFPVDLWEVDPTTKELLPR
jgi:hypothetical protein